MPSFFLRATAAPGLYTLSLHDALPISGGSPPCRTSPRSTSSDPARSASCTPRSTSRPTPKRLSAPSRRSGPFPSESEEHTSELQSPYDLVCRLLLEKKKNRHAPLRHLI